ncbi:MAG: peptidoglycan DD-metalloendopeptidase family protein [Gammaproteobacteria bacterium]|nr:peptidoglycan DD-metalloendopeptidase family protein [Gammaproteobacteria bacterium]
MKFFQFNQIIAVLLIFTISNISSAAPEKEQLTEVKQQLKQRQTLLKSQQRQHKKLLTKLKQTELNIAATAAKLHQTRQDLTANKRQQRQLAKQQAKLSLSSQQQQQALAKQLASAYMIGDNDLIQVLLNQEQSNKIERLLGYYSYINKARLAALDQLKATKDKLLSVEQAVKKSAQKLVQLVGQQQLETNKLAKNKKNRNSALATLNQRYLANSVTIEQLQLSEVDLKRLIKEAKKPIAPKQQPLQGLASRKGKLKLPSKGRLINKFGQERQGSRRWKGIIINGQTGQAVNVISHGRVLFADWIKGFGLVMVVDHGKGYMTLYGHNQTLLKQAGDYVQANEQIALLGQSGGQNKPVLYFELRHKGKAINPIRWLKS